MENEVCFDLVQATMRCAGEGKWVLMMMWTGSVIVFPCALSAVCAVADLSWGMVAVGPAFLTVIVLPVACIVTEVVVFANAFKMPV
jgi:hypothetical protein